MNDWKYGPRLGFTKKKRHFTEETRRKMSEVHKGKVFSDEHKERISQANKGRRLSEEAKIRISQTHKGLHHSEETKKKMSVLHKGENNAMYGKHHSEETRLKMKEAWIKRRQLKKQELINEIDWLKSNSTNEIVEYMCKIFNTTVEKKIKDINKNLINLDKYIEE